MAPASFLAASLHSRLEAGGSCTFPTEEQINHETSGPGATNYDFFTYSEPGDPWYNAARPWLHADGGGEKMNLLATDKNGLEAELKKNDSDLDKLFYFVAPERQFPTPK